MWNKTYNILLLVILAVVAAIVIWWGLVTAGVLSTGDFPTPDSTRWQAVFLTNDQVYFGRLENLDRSYIRLTHVYYLRAAEDLQKISGGQNQNLNLVKLGGELHGPEDAIYIPKDKVQFWENLVPTSQVVKAIEAAGSR